MFESVRGKGARSDIAIDDVLLSSGPCANQGINRQFIFWTSILQSLLIDPHPSLTLPPSLPSSLHPSLPPSLPPSLIFFLPLSEITTELAPFFFVSSAAESTRSSTSEVFLFLLIVGRRLWWVGELNTSFSSSENLVLRRLTTVLSLFLAFWAA